MSPLLIPGASSIRVAEYLTELPPREVLEKKLKAAVAMHKERLAAGGEMKTKVPNGMWRTAGNGA